MYLFVHIKTSVHVYLHAAGDKKTSYLLPEREKDSSVFIFELPETSVKETLTDRNEETQAKTPCSSLERNCDRDIQARSAIRLSVCLCLCVQRGDCSQQYA